METQRITVKVTAQQNTPCSDREYASCFANAIEGKKVQPYNVGEQREEDNLVIFERKVAFGKKMKIGDIWLVCDEQARAEVIKVE